MKPPIIPQILTLEHKGLRLASPIVSGEAVNAALAGLDLIKFVEYTVITLLTTAFLLGCLGPFKNKRKLTDCLYNDS